MLKNNSKKFNFNIQNMFPAKKRRVVITGMGAVSPLGLNVATNWANVLAGISGVRGITNFNAEDFSVRIGASLADGFDPKDYIAAKDLKKMDEFTYYAIAAATEAWNDSQIEKDVDFSIDRKMVGVSIGTGIGGVGTIARQNENLLNHGPRKISPFLVPAGINNMASGNFAIIKQLKGPNIDITTACASGTNSIGEAARNIIWGDADVMIAGGAEAPITPLGLGGFAAMRALSTRNDDPTHASRPWDTNRDGFVLGEGAGVVVLEELEIAKKRGAKIYGEVIGYGISGDGYHMTSPLEDGDGGMRAMQKALGYANVKPNEIDYINAHGTSTPTGDLCEIRAIRTLFKDYAGELSISSTKSMTGHLLGAAGAIEAIFSILAINNNIVPPTINLENPEAECEGLNLTPNKAQEREVKIAMSNSFGFGGTNACLVFKEFMG